MRQPLVILVLVCTYLCGVVLAQKQYPAFIPGGATIIGPPDNGSNGEYLKSLGDGTTDWDTPGGSGDITAVGDGASGDVFTADGTGNTLYFEGTSADAIEYIVTAADQTVTDHTWTWPNDEIADTDLLIGTGAGTFGFAAMSGDGTLSNGGVLTIAADSVALTTDTTGNYAAGDAEAGNALTGDSATAFFSSGTIEHEYGGLEADVNAYTGLLAISGGSTSEVDAKSELESQIADVSDFAEADGDIYTGTHDFGGATQLELPNSATYSPGTTAGQIGLDTTITSYDGLLRYYDGATEMVIVAMPNADLTTTDNDAVAYSTSKAGFNMEAQAGGGAMSTTDETSSTFTTSADTHHRVDVPADSSVTVTMHSPSDGDLVRITVADSSTGTGSFTNAPGYSVGFTSGTSINGSSYTGTTTGKWSLWVEGETLLLEYDSTQSTWWVIHDGRIAHAVITRQTTTGNSLTNGEFTKLTNFEVQGSDPAGIFDGTNDYIEVKRAGTARVGFRGTVDATADAITTINSIFDNSTNELERLGRLAGGASNNPTIMAPALMIVSSADKLTARIFVNENGRSSDVDPAALESLFTYREQL